MPTLTNKYHLHLILLGIGIFFFYLICLPQTVTLEDDGLFLLSSYFNGVSHPPGYPLHSLLGYFFTHLPFGNPALNDHALSALFSASSSVVIFLITLHLTNTCLADKTPPNLIAYIAAIAFTLSSAVWSQSIITEVYTLNSFLFLSVLLIAIKINKLNNGNNKATSGKSIKRLKVSIFYLGLFSGFALANHWPLFILGSIGIIYLFIPDIRVILKFWYLLIVGLGIGLTPYLWLYINSNSDTLIKFYGDLHTFHEFYDYVSRKNFNHSIDFSNTATITDKFHFLIYTLKQLVNQWGILNSIFVPLGIWDIFFKHQEKNRIFIALIISYFSASILLALILGYDFNTVNKVNIRPFFVLSHSIGAIFFAFGVVYVLAVFKRYLTGNFNLILIPIIVLQALAANGFQNYRGDYVWTTLYAKHVLDSIKPNSTLFVSGDTSVGTLGYWHFIKGYRPDITLIQNKGLIFFSTRLYDPRKTTPEEQRKIMLKYISSSKNSSYFIANRFNFGVDDHWLVYEYNPSIKDNTSSIVAISPYNEKYLDYIFSNITYTDAWTIDHRKELRSHALAHLMEKLTHITDKQQQQKIIHKILMLSHDLRGLTLILLLAPKFHITHLLGSQEKLIRIGWQLYKQEDDKKSKAYFLNLLANIRLRLGNENRSFELYRRSIQVWPNKDNKAQQEILTRNQK